MRLFDFKSPFPYVILKIGCETIAYSQNTQFLKGNQRVYVGLWYKKNIKLSRQENWENKYKKELS